jgi:hypothetical protein
MYVINAHLVGNGEASKSDIFPVGRVVRASRY